MVDKHRNYSVSLACAVCSGLFHPHHGREETSKYCGLKCSGVGRRGFQGAKTPKEKILKSIVVDPKTGCWNWIRSKKQSGYGLIRINGKETVAHRVSYEIFNNEPLGNLCACHHCDNPACVNPKHLFAGTPKDNALDKCRKGRHKSGTARGEDHPHSKLQAEDIPFIRNRSIPQKVIEDKYGISKTLIQRIRSKQAWAHIT